MPSKPKVNRGVEYFSHRSTTHICLINLVLEVLNLLELSLQSIYGIALLIAFIRFYF
jgi:hypothetical protein